MKTFLNEIRDIEQYLASKRTSGKSLVFEARMLTSDALRLNVHIQKKLLFLVKIFYRKKIRLQAEAVSAQIFADPSKREFQQKVSQIFNQ